LTPGRLSSKITGRDRDSRPRIKDDCRALLDAPLCAVTGVVYSQPPNSNSGAPDGNSLFWEIAPVNPQTLLVGSTSATGSTVTGTAEVLVVNTADPSNPTLVSTLQIPGMQTANDIAVDGDRALVVGSSAGVGVSGQIVVAMLDLTDPRNPTIISTQTLEISSDGLFSQANGTLVSLGNHQFAATSLGGTGDSPELLVFNTANPNDVIASQLSVPSQVSSQAVAGNLLYTASPSGLLIYDIGPPAGIPLTAQVTIPTNNGVSIVPNSFSLAPTKITTGADSETLVWKPSSAPA
jgi:hypothetical protein